MYVALVNPPETPGHMSFRDMAGGLGTSPKVSFLKNVFYKMNLEQHSGPPMDLLYTASVLESDGNKVEIIDALGLGITPEDTVAYAVRNKPDAIGVRMSLPSLVHDIKLINRLKAAYPKSRVFGFGPVIRTTYSQWINEFMGDFLIFGETEAIIPEALKTDDLRKCRGILFRDGGTVHTTSEWVLADRLNELPYPAWHLIPLKNYSYKRNIANFTFYVLSSRGCPNKCSMCPYPVHHGRKWRARSPDNVLEEMIYLKKHFGAVNIQFRDPNFAIQKKRTKELCECIINSGMTWRWSCEVDLQNLDEEIVDYMSRAGCVRIMTGIESTDQGALKDINQDASSIPKIEHMVEICKAKNIDLTGFYIVGFPSETWSSVNSTLEYARKIHTRSVVSLMTPYHGTELRNEGMKENLIKSQADFEAYNGFNCIMRSRHMDYDDVELAWKYVSSELDYINSELMFNKYNDIRKFGALVKMAENKIRYMPIRSMAKRKMKSINVKS